MTRTLIGLYLVLRGLDIILGIEETNSYLGNNIIVCKIYMININSLGIMELCTVITS